MGDAGLRRSVHAQGRTGTDQRTGTATWVSWNRPYYTERLKQGAGQFRDAALDTATS
jgi:hypothetical protein